MKTDNQLEFKRIALFYNIKIAGVEDLVNNILNDFNESFDEVIKVPLVLTAEGDLLTKYARQLIKTDLIVCVGGDGTVLRLAQSVIGHEIPIFGIRMGRLGFLTESTAQEAKDKINSILNGDYYIEKRKLVQANYNEQNYFALNDFVIGRKNLGKTASIGVWINGMPIAEYRSDAIIIASATGSTGYTLSIGGPVLMPSAESIIIMPLAPHLTPSNPIILPPGDEVALQVLRDDDSIMVADGLHEYSIETDKKILISVSKENIAFLRINNSYNFLNRVADRLGWLRKDHNLDLS